MTNFKKLMSLLMVLAMLVTFAAPTFADGEDQPSEFNVDITLEEGYIPKNPKITYNSDKLVFKDNQVTKKINKNDSFKIEIKVPESEDVSVEASSFKSLSISVNDKESSISDCQWAGSRFYNSIDLNRSNKPRNRWITIEGKVVRTNYTVNIKYSKRPVKDLLIIGGNKFTRENLIPSVERDKTHGNDDKSYVNDTVTIKFPNNEKFSDYYTLVKTFSDGEYVPTSSSSSNTDSKESINFKVSGHTIILVTCVKKGSNEKPLNFNFFEVNEGGKIVIDNNKDFKYTVGNKIDPSKFRADLTDTNDLNGEFDKAIIDQVGFKYQISQRKAEEAQSAVSLRGAAEVWEEINTSQALELADSGRIIRLIDRGGQEVARKEIEVQPLPPEEYTLTVESIPAGKEITVSPDPNGKDGKYIENTDVTFTVPDHEFVKEITIKSGDKELTPAINQTGNTYTHTITANTTFKAEYYNVYNIEVAKLADGNPTDDGGVNFDNNITNKAKENDPVKFSVTDIDGKRVKSVKVNGDEVQKDDNNKYSFTIKKDTKITVEYVTQVELKVNATEGGIILEGDETAILPKKFDKGAEVKFRVKKLDNKVIDTVIMDGVTLEPVNDVYTITMSGNKEINLTYKPDPLIAEKAQAKEKIAKLENLTQEQIKEEQDKVDQAETVDDVKGALKAAEQRDAKIKAEKEAKKALEAKQTELLGKIDEANLNDQEAVKALKKKVNDAKVGDNLETLEKDIINGIQEEKDKENFDAEKDKLKNQIAGSKLDDTTKTSLTQELEKATKPEDLANIRKELAAEITKAEEKAKAEKELKEAKDVAKEEIKKLGYLSPEEQAAAEKAIADATDKAGVKKAVADAEELNEKHKKEAEAEKALKKAKDEAKDTIGKLENLSPEEKKEALDKVDQAKNTDEIAEALKAAESKDALNKKAQEAKDAAEKAKDEAEKAKKAEEKAKEAEKAAKKAEEEKQAAEEKAKEAEKAKEEAAEKAKAAEEAAKEAKDKAAAEPNNADLAEKAEEAKEAEKKAKQEAKEAEEKANKAEEEKQAAEKAAKKAEEEKQAAKEAAKEAENKAKEAAEKAKEAEEKAKEAEKNIPATADEKEEAKKIIENLPNLSSSDKNIYKNKVDQATTKGEVEEALKAAEKKSDENHNVSPSIPEYHGYFMEPSPSYLNNGYTPRKEEPKKEEPKKEEKKQEVATTSEYTTLYFYLDKGYYETMIDGQAHQIPMDVQPTAINQRTMLPIRFVAEAIGATVEWHQDTKSATFTKDGITATITLGKDEITVSDGRTIKMDAEPTVISQRIMVPLTNISQIFGLTNGDTRDGRNSDIEWDQENYRVIIKIKK